MGRLKTVCTKHFVNVTDDDILIYKESDVCILESILLDKDFNVDIRPRVQERKRKYTFKKI